MIGTKPRPFIFIHIPKCAGLSIIRALIPEVTPYATYKELESMEMRRKYWITKTRTHVRLQFLQARMDTEGYFKFAFVRNPWDRAVSQVKYLIAQGANPPFLGSTFKENLRIYCESKETVCKHNLGFSQMDYLLDESGKMGMDFIGRFENLAKDFRVVCRRLGIKPVPELPHINPSKREEAYQKYFDRESAEWVRKRFENDIDHFGYEFGPVLTAKKAKRQQVVVKRKKARR